MIDWTNAHAAHGPTLAAWFIAHGLTDGEMKTSLARRVNAWSKGENPKLECVDRWLTSKGYHLSELPDEVWLADPILELLQGGKGVKAIARELGIAPATVRYHRQRVLA